MRILYVNQYFMTRQGVGNSSCYEFSRCFTDHDCRVTVIAARNPFGSRTTRRPWHRYQVDGISVIDVGIGSANYMQGNRLSFPKRLMRFLGFAVSSAIAVLRVERPDVVIVTSPPLLDGLSACLASLLYGAPLVLELHDLWPEAPMQTGTLRSPLLIRVAHWLERFLYARAAHAVVLSPGLREGLVAAGVPLAKISVIPVGTDIDLFSPDLDGDEVRKRLGLGDRFVCSYFGAMGRANGLQQLLQAAKLLHERGDNGIVFVLHGDGLQRDELEQYSARNGLINVVFSAAVPDKLSVAKLAAASDVCFTFYANVPSMRRASPAKFFDTMAAGRPAIVNVPGWIQDLVETHEVGVFVRPDDPADLMIKLLELRSDPQRLRRYGENARRLAERHFDRQRLGVKYLDILAKQASRQPARGRSRFQGHGLE